MDVDSENMSKVAILRRFRPGTYRIVFASQFYVDPLSFIGFGEFSYELGSKYSHLNSQHDFGGMTVPRPNAKSMQGHSKCY